MEEFPLYEVRDLKFRYDERFSLEVEHFIVRRGSSIGFVGPNGSGKSTFLRIMAFLLEPNEGELRFAGMKIGRNEKELTRAVTFLSQDPYLLKKTVFENVAYGLKVRGEREGLLGKVHRALLQVGLPPENFGARRWYELSGGEAQRVALASRLVLNPKLLILDEPTANVDKESSIMIRETIEDIRKKQETTLIIAGHDLVWLSSVTDDIEKMQEGRMVGFARENLLPGPWQSGDDDLWYRQLSDGQAIRATKPPDQGSMAVLDPSDLIISLDLPSGISARNILRGSVESMALENGEGRVIVTVNVSRLHLICRLTGSAVKSLQLVPGSPVWVIFKASSLKWQ